MLVNQDTGREINDLTFPWKIKDCAFFVTIFGKLGGSHPRRLT